MKDQNELLAILSTDVAWIKKALEEMRGDLPQRYAAKWTQHVVAFMLSTAGVAILGALLGLILIKPTLVAFAYITSLFYG